MNHEAQNPSRPELLISAYLDGTLDESGVTELRQLLNNEPGLLHELARMTQLEEHVRALLAEQAATDFNEPGSLLDALQALAAGEEDSQLIDMTDQVIEQPQPRPKPRVMRPRPEKPEINRVLVIPRSLAYAAALALVAGVVVAVFALNPKTNEPGASELVDHSAARIDRTRRAQWVGNTPDADGRMMPGLYRLEHGFVEMTFVDGASVLIQGPSSFELLSGSRMELMTGMASATVPDGSEGFTIVSPVGEFVDLGTAFGVDISGAGQAELHVFEGEVEAHTRSKDSKGPVVVHGGEAVALDEINPVPEKLVYRPEKFATDWDDTDTGIEVSRSIRMLYQPPASVREHQLEHNEQIVMFAENRGVLLEKPLRVSFDQPGRYVRFYKPPMSLEAGTRVDSYFVHFDRVGSPEDSRLIPVNGVVTFDRPVLAVIANDEWLDRSQRLFRLPGTNYPHRDVVRGLEFRPAPSTDPSDLDNYQDMVVLSSDRRTLRLHLETSSRIDQLRILVQAEEQP